MPSHVPCFGLTGGIASGKSTLASCFAALGAKVIDADRIGHQLLEEPGPAFDEVAEHFGERILNPSGRIDRTRLAAIAFATPHEREKLNAILHPRIIARQEEIVRELHRAAPDVVILVDAALIYEAQVENLFTKIIVAWCTPEQQIERVMTKTGLPRDQAQMRIAAQMPAEEKRRRADFVIDCSGSVDYAREQVERLCPRLKALVLAGTTAGAS